MSKNRNALVRNELDGQTALNGSAGTGAREGGSAKTDRKQGHTRTGNRKGGWNLYSTVLR
jgi:hypothetical protein